MEAVLIKLLNMSITASYLALAVMALRLVLKKAPKWIFVALWAMVGLRLVLPFSFESIFSAVPNPQPVPQTILTDPVPQVNTGISFVNSVVNPMLEASFAPAPGDSVNPMQIVMAVAGYVYLAGVAAMLAYTAVSYFRLKARVKEAVRREGRVYICDRIPSPFILGLVFPKIYLPSSLPQEDMPYVIAHENAHLKRLDHIWKPLGFMLLTLHWFNPVLWLGYILLCRDIEAACDEKVLKGNESSKKAYAEALLKCSVSRKSIAACPLAFGETGVKGRIKNVLNYKKPAFWVILLALIAGIVLGVCLLTDPPKESPSEPVETAQSVPQPHTLWFDIRDNDGSRFHAPIVQLPQFPGITLEATSQNISITVEKAETITVIGGMPIQNAYLCDVTGDSYPDICATVSYGSGMVDQHIVVYDIYNGRRTTIWARGETDYCLGETDGQLSIMGRAYLAGQAIAENYECLASFTPEALERFGGKLWEIHPYTYRQPQETAPVQLDLNGDGRMEVCYDVSFGSGIVDRRVMIYDYANGKVATIEDRFATDYSFVSIGGTVYLASRPFQGQPANEVPFTALCPLDDAAVENYSKRGWEAIEVPAVYQNLDSSRGLTVCVWQMAEYSYSCVLFSGKDAIIDQFALAEMPTTGLHEMRSLLEGYGLPDEQVRVAVVQMLHSSYIGRTDEAFVMELRQQLGLEDTAELKLPYYTSKTIDFSTAIASTTWTDAYSDAPWVTFAAHQVVTLPVWHCASVEELAQLQDALGKNMDMDSNQYGFPSFNQLAQSYGEEFFKNKSLMVAYAPAPHSGYQFLVNNVTWYSNGEMKAAIYWNGQLEGDEVYAGRLICIAVDKTYSKSCHKFSANTSYHPLVPIN